MKSKKFYDDDDDRVIARMDVDGMPWHNPMAPERDDAAEDAPRSNNVEPPPKLTRREMLAYTWGALKAALCVAAVFAIVYFLFILFCTEVWFA